jgi:hypothetical protein
MDIYRGGLCHIDKEKRGTEGDHLLYFKAESLNYEIGANQCNVCNVVNNSFRDSFSDRTQF